MSTYNLSPGDIIPETFLNELKIINAEFSKDKNFFKYKANIKQFLGLQEPALTDKSKAYLAGFIEGEGSLSVSIKKHKTAKFGILLDPVFNITQHVNGVSNLYLAMCVFSTGRLSYKAGSNATLVYRIDNRTSLKEKVIPFFDKYVVIHGSPAKTRRKQLFAQILQCFDDEKHTDLTSLVQEMLPLWDELRVQRGYANESFATLQEAQSYVMQFGMPNQKY